MVHLFLFRGGGRKKGQVILFPKLSQLEGELLAYQKILIIFCINFEKMSANIIEKLIKF